LHAGPALVVQQIKRDVLVFGGGVELNGNWCQSKGE
jgi:hypothetical protein